MAITKMQPLMNKTESSLPPFFGFKNFIVALLRNRIFLLFLILDALALSLQWINPLFSLPPSYYFGFAFAGLVWSAFQAYQGLSLAYRNILFPKPVEKIPQSELSVSFLSGNEYTYSICDPYAEHNLHITRMQKTRGVKCRFDGRGVFIINDKVYYPMSKASLVINIRMENTGDLPLEVLSIRLENSLNLNYLNLSNEEVSLYGKKLCFPFPLKSGEFVVLQSRYMISASKDSNDDLFAADFRALPRSISHEILFDTKDVHGKGQTYVATIATSSRPLIDLYVKQWQEFDQEEYLLLAGYSS
jgi:hypothetical protein